MAEMLSTGAVVAGRFRLERLLGRGSMGSVWRATHLGLEVPCAVKFMEGYVAKSPELAARFEREAKAAAKLRSPNVVQILDYGVFQRVPYIAMELLEGEDLGKRLERARKLPPAEVVRITREIARALTRAHAEGVVHRDLKPENVFLAKDVDGEVVKVVDFGLAKAPTPSGGRVTRAGEVLGTPYYMSPEQVRGAVFVDARSDLWSLGVIVFRCLTGVLPFEAPTLLELLTKITSGPIPIPSAIAPELPRAFDAWWARASQRDPALRFQSARDLDVALASALEGATVQPLRASTAPLARSLPAPPHRPARAAWWLGGAALASFVAVAALVAVVLQPRDTSAPATARAARETATSFALAPSPALSRPSTAPRPPAPRPPPRRPPPRKDLGF